MFSKRRTSVRARPQARASSNFRSHLIRGMLSLGVVFLIAAGIYYGTRLDMFLIDTVEVEGGYTISHDTIRTQTEQLLHGTYWGLVPKRFVYLYPQDTILEVVSRVPLVRSAVVVREGTELRVTFDEYVPAALWCAQNAQEEPCRLLSEDGIAFAEAPRLKGSAFVRHFTESEVRPEVAQVVDAPTLADLAWFVARLENDLDFRIISILHKQNKDIELSISGGGMFIIAGGRDIRTTYDNLTLILASTEYAHLRPGNFNYIDLRFDKKVFVNEVLAEE